MSLGRVRVARRVGTVLLLVVALAVTSTTPAGAEARHRRPSTATVLQDGLSSPKGLTAFWGVAPIVAQGAFGPPGPVVLSVRPGTTVPLSGPIGLTDVVLASDYSLWGLSSEDGLLYRKSAFGGFRPVADIAAYQATDPDPDNGDDGPADESNPYGLAALPNGEVLVADAANNDVLRVDKRGRIRTVARFAREVVSTDHIPGFPGPSALPAESVPTSIAVTRNAIYVGELKGFPFRPSSSKIYRIGLDALGATCSATAPNQSCRVVEDGLTAIQDIAVDPWTGAMYVYELAADGTLAFEEGLDTGQIPPAVLLELRHGQRRELAAGQLSQPGGVVAALGKVHVTDEVFTGGRLLRVRG